MASKFHALMYPWLATGHITPFLHLANKLGEKGHRVTFLLPKKTLKQFEYLNMYPHTIAFCTVTVPHVDGLPLGVETSSDIPISSTNLLASAMDLTRPQVEDLVRDLKPDVLFFDFAHWIPDVAREFGAKSIDYLLLTAPAVACLILSAGSELGVQPPDYPSSTVLLHKQDAFSMKPLANSTEDLNALRERFTASVTKCDVILIKACKELEGEFCNYVEKKFKKKIFFTGPMLPQENTTIQLEEKWSNWLSRFKSGSVVFCAFGSQTIMEKDQFQELCLGMELTGLPFLVAVKPPRGTSTVQEALPEGFEERVKGRGIVWGGWVQQPLILSHPSVGCFVSHCGLGSMWESLVSDCQIVLVPQIAEQIINTRLMSKELEVSVEVAREETGWFSKESLGDAIESVMNRDSELGNRVRKNHIKWRETVTSPGLMNGYVDDMIELLNDLIAHETNHD